MSLDVAAVRAQFPLLQQTANGKPLVYLDTAATSQKPQVVIDAVNGHYAKDNANIHRAVYQLAARATNAYEAARKQLATFLNAPSSEELVFVRGATEGINLVAHSFVRPRLKAGDEILVTEMEHHANIVPWQLIAAQVGAKVVAAPMTDNGDLDMDAFVERINANTKFIGVVHVSNAIGTVNPIHDICALARERGIPILVDGAQSVQHGPVDLQALDCDFFAFSGHKVYAPTGTGVLWGKAEHLAAMPPYQGGGDMIRTVDFGGTTFADPPARFEAGTPNIAGAVGLGAAVEWLSALGMQAVADHEHAVTEALVAAIDRIDGAHVVGRPKQRASAVSFKVDGLHHSDIGSLLDQYGVAVRTGHHCAQPLMTRFGISGTARCSIGVYNTLQDVERFEAALGRIVERFT
jgi:cysteine desulfurase/selenocysteine lyase